MNDLKLALAHPSTPADAELVPTVRPAERRDAGQSRLGFWRRPEFLLALAIFVGGSALRIVHWAAWAKLGYDEVLYGRYLHILSLAGLGEYPKIVDTYKEYQATVAGSVLPPTRFLYILFAYGWYETFGGHYIDCFRAVSRVFGVATLALSGAFAWRLLPSRRLALGVFALMAFSPIQIHLAQHALLDGFFEFWALGTLWALWECLRHPGHKGWLTAYTAGLALMVLTKENAFFVWVAIVALLVANRWLQFGVMTRPLAWLTLVGPLVGVALLIDLAGGPRELLDVYRLGVPKNLTLAYAVRTGDGPWYRYLLDLMTVSPVVLLLAASMVLHLRFGPDPTATLRPAAARDDRPLIFLLGFVVASYVLMCNVKYGINLRYASIWDLPLRALAVAQVGLVAARLRPARPALTLGAIVVFLCAFDVFQYYRLAVEHELYELVPADLLRNLNVLKP